MLESLDEGQALLKLYERDGAFDKTNALKLCDIIMRHEFCGDPKTSLYKKDFITLAKAINECFPNEPEELYYTPAQHSVGKKGRAKGRLTVKYDRRRKFLSVARR